MTAGSLAAVLTAATSLIAALTALLRAGAALRKAGQAKRGLADHMARHPGGSGTG